MRNDQYRLDYFTGVPLPRFRKERPPRPCSIAVAKITLNFPTQNWHSYLMSTDLLKFPHLETTDRMVRIQSVVAKDLAIHPPLKSHRSVQTIIPVTKKT